MTVKIILKYIFPILLVLGAISVSFSAAYYSVFGLAKVFSGAEDAVIRMAVALEVSKIILAASLHFYWNNLTLALKSFLSFAVIVLVVITSAGIYGFLSSAYKDSYIEYTEMQKNVEVAEKKIDRYNDRIGELKSQKERANADISNLREALSNPAKVEYIDGETGQKVTTTSRSARRSLENQLNDVVDNRESLDGEILSMTDSVGKYEVGVLDMENSTDIASELGPLKYLSDLTGYSMDVVINWFILLIIIVFDPLAISMVIFSIIAFLQIKNVNNKKQSERSAVTFGKISKPHSKKKRIKNESGENKNNKGEERSDAEGESSRSGYTKTQRKNMPHQEYENLDDDG